MPRLGHAILSYIALHTNGVPCYCNGDLPNAMYYLGKLGEGAWGVVTEAVQEGTGRRVAIKKIRMSKFREGTNFTALREIKALQEMKHENVVQLVDVFLQHEVIEFV